MKIPQCVNQNVRNSPQQQQEHVRYKGEAIGRKRECLRDAGYKGRYYIFFSSDNNPRWRVSQHFKGGCTEQYYFKVIQ